MEQHSKYIFLDATMHRLPCDRRKLIHCAEALRQSSWLTMPLPCGKLLRILLETRGYTVLDSGDPAEALRMARDHKGPLPLMITDVSMPGFNGHVLAERLAVERPEARVLYISGNPDDADARHDLLGPYYTFLEKPFTSQELVGKVREILDSPQRVAI
jgi:DNA-binding NtrC family response regulator